MELYSNHGYPTSSFDFMELFDLLSMDYYVCVIDTQGENMNSFYVNFSGSSSL